MTRVLRPRNGSGKLRLLRAAIFALVVPLTLYASTAVWAGGESGEKAEAADKSKTEASAEKGSEDKTETEKVAETKQPLPAVNGAGATFPWPIFRKWMSQYTKETGNQVAYIGIGSGGGIAQIKAATVDFGATDRPLDPRDLTKAGLIQFPIIMGGVVPVVNVSGFKAGQLKLTDAVLVDILLGKIRNWSDRRIRAINANLELPDKEITVCHRADGSGTTFIFTTYLSKVSEEWKKKIGKGKAVKWPTGVGGKGNPGVAELVKRLDGAIGYVEFAYALENNLKYAKLQNREGYFVEPIIENFQAAAENVNWKEAPGFVVDLTDQPGRSTWPIVGVSYILMYKKQKSPEKAHALTRYFHWCFTEGGDLARKLLYVPMPPKVVELVEAVWKENIVVDGKPVFK